MCDDSTVRDNENFLRADGALTRRRFGALAASTAVATLLPAPAGAAEVLEQDVTIPTDDGNADCYLAHPASGQHPAVIVWPDVLSLRPAFRAMGRRLAQSGYTVLVVNPYYRVAQAPVVPEGASFQQPAIREHVLPMARSLSAATNVTDARAFVTYLDSLAAVDTSRGIGTSGYCMGGAMTMRTAAAIPDRVKAGASFHSGSLVQDSPDSPHLLAQKMQASYLVAIAQNDDERQPDAKVMLVEAFQTAGLPAEIEVYKDTLHGWCPPDSKVYNELQAEHAWARMLHLFDAALG